MSRKQNVILFSAGESVRRGKVDYIRQKLEESGLRCSDWRMLFTHARNQNQLSLLPSLLKKIPTYDFAVVLADPVDEVLLRSTDALPVMRDNVLFELGLCIMGLGVDRVILLADKRVHLPDDLSDHGGLGVKTITYASDEELELAVAQLASEIEKQRLYNEKQYLQEQLTDLSTYVKEHANTFSPVFVGAAISSAEAYYKNMILRLLENADHPLMQGDELLPEPKAIRLEICFPEGGTVVNRHQLEAYYGRRRVKAMTLKHAGTRDLSFRGRYNEKTGVLTVVDVPTSITATYTIVTTILQIDSDEMPDPDLHRRFNEKEMDMYAQTIRRLCTAEITEKRLSPELPEQQRQQILKNLARVRVRETVF